VPETIKGRTDLACELLVQLKIDINRLVTQRVIEVMGEAKETREISIFKDPQLSS
jgi:hypothetical protein